MTNKRNAGNQALAAPAGWKLVPIEPTKEMIDAAHKVADGGQDDPTAALFDLWHDMLAVAPAFTKTFVIEQYEGTWKEGEWEGDERAAADVEELPGGAYRIELQQYYSKDGVFQMTISQPLDRAMRTFVAALRADTELETAQDKRTEAAFNWKEGDIEILDPGKPED
ncbi:hypothetical protein SAMN05444161_2655 [Rhizobiales bacterium GAS191]|nr:hypothetical protein SAMN05444161_2655 [Rhizobiales bacterium GAS191]